MNMIRKLLLAPVALMMLLSLQQARAGHTGSPGEGGVSRKKMQPYADIEIRGLITDSTGTPIPGVTIIMKNKTSTGTTTDVNGRYILVVPDNATIIASMIGYEPQEIPVNGRTSINITLKQAYNNLNETVVVAYGTQKKKEMVGSVTSINPGDLKVPASNLTTALAGRAAGLIAYQTTGEPGADNANFFIRGVTTFGYKRDPLILIDGVELTTEDLARLRPDDIESFSIMKDATSTALYGARGANGVILVTTKKGMQGPSKLSLRVENSFSAPTKNVELADPVTYMTLANEAAVTRRRGAERPYHEDKIVATQEGRNPLVYPANDWYDMLFKDYTTVQRADLSVRGGGNVARYYVAGAFSRDNGIMEVDNRNNYNTNIKINRYSLRANVDVDLTKSTTMAVKAYGNFEDYTGPIGSDTRTGGSQMYWNVMHSNPVLFPAYFPAEGEYAHVKHIMFGNAPGSNAESGSLYLNPYATMVMGYREQSRSFMSAQMEVKQTLDFFVPGLVFRTMMNVNRTSVFDINRFAIPFFYGVSGYNKHEDHYNLLPANGDQGTEYLNFNQGGRDMNAIFYWESALSYNQAFGSHNVSAMLINILRSSINPQGLTLQETLARRNSGLSGRVTYNYDSRYFAEFNFGYNGSERFYEKYRFGFFPSAGVAWTISNEKFFDGLRGKIDNLKVRATYGLVGNDAIGSETDRFFYLSQTNPNDGAKGAVFGRDNTYARSGYSISRYSNPLITWERSYQSNIALELGLFKKLTFTGEYYTSQRRDILLRRENIPTTMGLAGVPQANLGAASSRGTDLSLNYTTDFKNGAWLQTMANFTYARSRYEKLDEPDYPASEWYRSRVGYSVNQMWGLIAERLFVDDEEARNAPPQQFGEVMGGDIKYTDVNRDGRITAADMVPIGYPTVPEITYGFGFSAGYKNFDISSFFQGSGRQSFWINAGATSPFSGETQLLKAYADDHWSEENRNVYALWPRLSLNQVANNTQTSTWFMRSAAFVRLKQLEIGYTLPKPLQRRLRTSTFRVYMNGSNLFVISPFKMWDVEMGGNGLAYPIQRVVNIGLNVTFN